MAFSGAFCGLITRSIRVFFCRCTDTKQTQHVSKTNSSLPRSSSRHQPGSVPDSPVATHGPPKTPSTSAAQLPPTPSKSKGSMLDKFRLFGTKGRPDKENVSGLADSSTEEVRSSKTGGSQQSLNTSSESSSRTPRLPVRNRRDDQPTTERSHQGQGPLTEAKQNAADGRVGSLPPGGGKTMTNSSKVSKVRAF